MSAVEIFSKIFACYGIFLIAVAVIFNPLVVFICIKSKKLRSTSTFVLLSFSSINDLISLFGWNQEGFAMAMFDYAASYMNLAYCRWVSVFLQYSTLQYASWMLVSISLDRLLSLSFKKWSKQYFSGFRPMIYSIVLAVVILGLNFVEVFTSGHMSTFDGVDYVICYETDPSSFDWYDLMEQWFVYFGYIVPYALLVIINSLIIYKATRFSRSQNTTIAHDERRKIQMTRTILVITFLYIGMSLPGAIVTGYFYGTIYSLSYGSLIINLLNAIQFSYPAYHFLILFFSNRLFAQEVKSMLSKMGKNSVSTSLKTQTSHDEKSTKNRNNSLRL